MFFLRNIPNTQQQLSNSKLTYSTLTSSRRWWSGSGSTLAEVSTLNSSSFGDRVKSERRKGTGIGLGRPQEGRLDPDLHRRLFEKEEKQQKSNSIQLEVVCILHSSIQYQVRTSWYKSLYVLEPYYSCWCQKQRRKRSYSYVFFFFFLASTRSFLRPYDAPQRQAQLRQRQHRRRRRLPHSHLENLLI